MTQKFSKKHNKSFHAPFCMHSCNAETKRPCMHLQSTNRPEQEPVCVSCSFSSISNQRSNHIRTILMHSSSAPINPSTMTKPITTHLITFHTHIHSSFKLRWYYYIQREEAERDKRFRERLREMGRAPCCDKATVKKGPWSPEEDAMLKNYIEEHGTGGNWIALPHKIGKQLVPFLLITDSFRRDYKFSDMLRLSSVQIVLIIKLFMWLFFFLEMFSNVSSGFVCSCVVNLVYVCNVAGLKRCGKSCRLRWLNYLRPNIKHGDFTPEEDSIICSLYISIGSRYIITPLTTLPSH